MTLPDEPIVLTERGQAWLRAQLDARIDELASIATRLTDHVQTMARAPRDGEVPITPPQLGAERERYVALVDELAELTAALREAVSVAEVEEDPAIVELGDEVEVELPDGVLARWCIVHPLEAAMGSERIAVTAPLARAVLGHRPGERVTVVEEHGVYGVHVTARRRLQ